jgi:hypothetical protein
MRPYGTKTLKNILIEILDPYPSKELAICKYLILKYNCAKN